MQKKWWKETVVYQIYPRSFYDSNQDGIGDLAGVARKLPYIKAMGVDTVWICPFFKSPMKDNGYDISDYYDIDPQFGTMEDMDYLLQEAKKNEMHIILDMVLNHTSDQHKWFQEACRDRDSEYREYYIFRDSIDEVADLRSNFGGSTWTQIADGSWYFHTFAKEQPDLNWENEQMRQDIYDMVNWWLDKGVSGFRLDAITYIKKNMAFPKLPADGEDGRADVSKSCLNYPGIDALLEDLKVHTYGRGEFVTVAEAPGVAPEDLHKFIGEQGHFSMIFDFSYTDIDIYPGQMWIKNRPWTVAQLKDLIFANQKIVQQTGWAANYLENHDQPRSLNKYFSHEERQKHGREMAKALGTLFFFLRGTPFIYQGEELGLCNTEFQDINEVDDVNSIGQYTRCISAGYSEREAMESINQRSRDHARLPMQWNGEENCGFSKVKPWIQNNSVCRELTVEAQEQDADSVLNFYKKMIWLRQASEYSQVITYGDFEEVETTGELICYKRVLQQQQLYVAINMGQSLCTLPEKVKEILLCNYDSRDSLDAKELRPYEAVVWCEEA